ncbi:hypothetical protein YT1_0750 [Rhodococcus ruber]|nr:hypothetical protein YT1_0750 [Rhodococcus ruber]
MVSFPHRVRNGRGRIRTPLRERINGRCGGPPRRTSSSHVLGSGAATTPVRVGRFATGSAGRPARSGGHDEQDVRSHKVDHGGLPRPGM